MRSDVSIGACVGYQLVEGVLAHGGARDMHSDHASSACAGYQLFRDALAHGGGSKAPDLRCAKGVSRTGLELICVGSQLSFHHLLCDPDQDTADEAGDDPACDCDECSWMRHAKKFNEAAGKRNKIIQIVKQTQQSGFV